MKTKLTVAFALAVLLFASACGSRGDDGGTGANASPGGITEGGAPEIDATIPDDVEEAPEGGLNRPAEGTYVYALKSETENAATADAPVRTSAPDAEWQSTISYEGDDEIVQKDKISEGSAVSTVRRIWGDDGVREVSFGTTTDQGTGDCTFTEPIVVLEIPIEEGKLPTHEFEGEGVNCNGERTITVEQRDDATDANGHVWPAWRIKVTTVVKATGLTKTSTDTRWFSPDLGKDIRVNGVTEYVNPSGGVAARATTEILLKRYPKA
jgi:hypothetical protein